MHILNWLDYIILFVIALSVLVSLVRGFIKEAFSLAIWAAAFWVAFTFYNVLSNLLTNYIQTPSLRLIIAFGFLFIITLLIGAFINYLLAQLIDKTGLSGTDRLFGVAFGLVRGILLVTIVIMMARLTPFPNDPWWKDSLLLPYFKPMESWLHSMLPQSAIQHINLIY